MARYGLRSSKPHAVLVAVLGTALVAYGIVRFAQSGHVTWFAVLWAAVGLVIVGAVLWQAFGSRRGRGTPVEVDDTGERPRGSARLWGMDAARDDEPGSYRLRPSKPMAVVSAVFGIAIMVFGIVVVGMDGAFLVLWIAFGLGITGFNLWSAFARKGATEVVERRDGNDGRYYG